MADLSIQTIARAGITPAYVAAAGGGDAFANSGKELIHIKNGGSTMTLTIVTQATQDGLAVADRAVVVTGGEERVIGPFPASIYNDGTGKVQLTYSAVTTVTIGIFNPGT